MRTATRRIVSLAAITVLTFGLGWTAPASADPIPAEPAFFVLTPVASDTGPALIHGRSAAAAERRREQPLLRPGGNKPGHGGGGVDAAGSVQTSATTPLGSTLVRSFDGVGVGLGGYADCCAPPDTNASVGATQIVEWVNLDYAVFDKAGTLLRGPTAGNTPWAGFAGGNCATNNDGDPIVKYDAQAHRWFITQFSVTGGPPYYECIAVSSGEDFLTSSWARYAYSFGTNFPDYPKAGVWPDGYYMSFNLFANGRTFAGAGTCAFDRAKMLVADPNATGQCFQLSTSYGGLLPSDLDGATGATGSTLLPPAGAPNTFASFGTNQLNLWKFHVDFATPANTTFTGPTALAVPAFSTACGGGACIPQAGTTNQLDSLGDRLMYRLAYRNFGDRQALVVTHSTKGSGTAATRWYELRSTGTGYSVYQASSYAPDSTYRWMGSAAMDKLGNMAIGYSASSSTIKPGIRYTGRAATDPLNTLRQEATILDGGGAQTGTLHRWGDYSSLAVDPTDDCTFWFATEYLKADGSFNWSTRIASFKLSGCP